MKEIAVLLTVHNRKNKTLACLQCLYRLKLPNDFACDVWMTDDGCTDGTPEAVKSIYPHVHIVNGDGSLFWNRGMWTAWNAAANYKDYDLYLWLNDDTLLFENALTFLLALEGVKGGKSIIVGSVCSSVNPDIVTYGGIGSGGLLHPSKGVQLINQFNGNVVLIPNEVFRIVGFNDYYYRHSFGDADYGLMATKKGISCFMTDSFVGSCERHDGSRKCWDSNYSLRDRLKYLYSPLGFSPNEVFHFYNKHQGFSKACIMALRSLLRTVFC